MSGYARVNVFASTFGISIPAVIKKAVQRPDVRRCISQCNKIHDQSGFMAYESAGLHKTLSSIMQAKEIPKISI